MKPNRIVKAWIAVLCSIALVGGGAALMSAPASAQASINWKHIWKTQIRPRADKRYYTKLVANGRFARIGSSYTKAESDGKYTPTGTSYTKAESDTKYAPFPSVIRGTYSIFGNANAGQLLSQSISWGVSLSAAPTVHFINVGAPVPVGCSGTALAPNAAPGNLCVFESFAGNTTSRGIFDPSTSGGLFNQASVFGAGVFAGAVATGGVQDDGSWAVRPLALSSSSIPASRNSGPGATR